MKTKKLISPNGLAPKTLPAEMETKKSPLLLYVIGGLALVYFLTMKKK
jgi:hypothetical protein